MFSIKRVGGIRFVRIGQLQVSFCVTRKAAPLWTADRVVGLAFGLGWALVAVTVACA